jgi:hypothetical protein
MAVLPCQMVFWLQNFSQEKGTILLVLKCASVREHTQTHTRTHSRAHTHTHAGTRTHTRTHARKHTRARAHTHTLAVSSHISMHTHLCTDSETFNKLSHAGSRPLVKVGGVFFKGFTKSIYLHVTKALYFAVLYIRMFEFLYRNE